MARKKKAKKTPGRDGRPSKFTPEMAEKILSLARKGEYSADICEHVGICVATLFNWKQQYPEFLKAFNEAREHVDDLVERALLKRALGYSHSALKMQWDGERGKWQTKAYTEQYAPDTTAATFWLKNRRAKEWKESSRLEHAGDAANPVQIIVNLPSNGREAK